MRVAIYGSGAMGTILGAFLTKNGQDVVLIDNYKEHVDSLNRSGAKVIGQNNLTVPVKAITPEEMTGIYDIIFLFTKQTVNHLVLPYLKRFMNDESVICTLQNGVPEYSVADIIGKNRTVGGTVLWAATFVEPGVSEVTQDVTTGVTLANVGEIDGQITDRIKKVANVLEAMGAVDVVKNLIGTRWTKLLVNCSMSAMSAVTGGTFGEVLDHSEASACLSYIATEVKAVADKMGINMEPAYGIEMSDYALVGSPENLKKSKESFVGFFGDKRTAIPSMLQDLKNNKKTEVEMINGFVVNAGEKVGIDTSFNNEIVRIINAIEEGKLKSSFDNVKRLTSLM